MDKNSHVNQIIEIFSKDVKTIFGDNVVSVILTGSAVTENYNPKVSDINFLVIIKKHDFDQLKMVRKFVRKWSRKKISVPLFLTEEYIQKSLDSFPIEFFNMKSNYILVYGKDVLKNLKFKNSDVRLQCERELKGKLLHLRQGYINTMGSKTLILRLIRESFVSFASIFRALLLLKNEDSAGARDEVIEKTCEIFNLDHEIFIALNNIKEGTLKLSAKELDLLMVDYVNEISNLSQSVDSM